MRRKPYALIVAGLTVLVTLAVASPAFADLLSPESGGSPNADRIDTLYWVIFSIALVIFAGVEGTLLYSVIKFRARKGAVAAQIHGNSRLEVGWTAGAAVIVVGLAVVTFALLPGIRHPATSSASGLKLTEGVQYSLTGPASDRPKDGKSLHVCVNGQQYLWRFTYTPDCSKNDFSAPFSYYRMVVPVDTTVTLEITSQDVAHSWWVPQLGGKFDAVPGYVNRTWFKVPAKLAGKTFAGHCAELCGRNHANMNAQVQAVTPAQFTAWLKRQKTTTSTADNAAEQQRKQYSQ
ncbi:MAG TPA: cytochrome c oxidase subunit II [Solirubrobacteraceae bacterium]|nr:cytochrome c oxidase subunit II [Solirubrobacteraceae bacterium]